MARLPLGETVPPADRSPSRALLLTLQALQHPLR